MLNIEVHETSVMQVRSSSKSLKVTIPEFYVELLGIKKGDKLQWSHEQIATGEFLIKIRKAKK